ncbi:MAG: hypothetical protein ABI898_08205 [Sphingomonadales bacterium]
MYSDTDIESAVAAGILTSESAAALRNHTASLRTSPSVDEEHFRLITGFNDIFVSIAIVLLVVAVAWIGQAIRLPLAGASVAVVSWGLAEYFTRVRRMALPSILLLLAFAGGVAGTFIGFMVDLDPNFSDQTNALIAAGIAAVTAVAIYAHWRRFMVPITVAVGAIAVAATAAGLIVTGLTDPEGALPWISLVAGLAIFALAMRWDMSDRARVTRRSDVAFWLHLAAAPLIAHPIFQELGVLNGAIPAATAAMVLALYVGFGLVALAIDRRALLVSSLAYVLFALTRLFENAGAVELATAFTALIIGSALLTLSAFWHPMRSLVVERLPAMWRDRLPLTGAFPARV